MELRTLAISSARALEVPQMKLGVFDRIAQNGGMGKDSTPTDLSVFAKTVDIMAPFDLHEISPNQMATLGTALYESGSISFRDYSRFVVKPLAADPEQTKQLREQPRDAIKDLQIAIEWQERQADPRLRVGLAENKLLLNVMENLNSLKNP